MHDCAPDVLAFHNEKVTLPQPERTRMRDHRNANRKRLKDRLGEAKFPLPKEFIKQGSYAMLTMVQDDDNDYDIDDGVYFAMTDLSDKDGNPLTSIAVRQRVSNALQDDRFNKPPKVLRNCVRVFYNEGYHVDMPIYRIRKSDGQYELASGDQWVVSRAADVEDWFRRANESKSPDEDNGRQFRRIVRLLKKFARSRSGWKSDIASGFMITRLVEECYVADDDREDFALRRTMEKLEGRLQLNLEVSHPTTTGSWLTTGPDDKAAALFRDKLREALDKLAVLDAAECTPSQALGAWDKIFNTDFFSMRSDKGMAVTGGVAILTNLLSNQPNPRPVNKEGGGRFA